MLEFVFLVVALGLVLYFASRTGTAHLEGRIVLGVMMSAGWTVGLGLYAMPFTAVGGEIGVSAILAGICGLFAGRLMVRIAQAWAMAYKGWEEKDPENPPRLVHPAIAVGLFLSGVPVLFSFATMRHEALEAQTTPRHPETGIVRGAEPIATDPDADTDHAVLLLHGLAGNPSNFGPLPQMFADAGYAVRAPLLPGHGTRPDDLMGRTHEDWVAAAQEAYDALVADERYAKVSIVGFSFGGTLALSLDTSKHAPAHLVLVNPFFGELATPDWSPLPTDDLLPVAARLTARVIRPESMARLADRSAMDRLITYRTMILESAMEARECAEAFRESGADVPDDALVLLSVGDQTVPAAVTEKLLVTSQARVLRYEKSDHLLFLDHDGTTASEAVVGWIGGE